jgi:uncharacterized protein (DUF488 family)
MRNADMRGHQAAGAREKTAARVVLRSTVVGRVVMTLFTIGHSNHPLEYFLALLRAHGIETLCDVRTTPYSRFHPQFNQRTLRQAVEAEGMAYLYLGQALGGKPKAPGYPADAQARFALIAATPEFQGGMARLLETARARRTAILCAERDPAPCHRTLLVCAHLPAGIAVRHILADGSLAEQGEPGAAAAAGTHPELPLRGRCAPGSSRCENSGGDPLESAG